MSPGAVAGPGRGFRRSAAAVALLAALAAAAWTFAVVGGRLGPPDQAVFDAVARLRTEAGLTVMIAIGYLGSEYLTPVLLLAAALAVGRRSPCWGWFVALLAVSANLWQIALKHLLSIPRPPPLFPYWQKAGYPSGHTLVGLCFAWSVLLYLRCRHPGAGGRLRPCLYALLAVWPFVIGVSRVYVAAHWFSDIVGGLLIGVMHLSAAWWLYGGRLDGEGGPGAHVPGGASGSGDGGAR